jgi:hypothetical protein
MKPKINKDRRNIKNHKIIGRVRGNRERRKIGHDSTMLIASLQALLSIANFLEMFHSLRSLLIDSSQVSLTSTYLYIIDSL